MNPLKQLYESGQSVWLDYIRRSLITSGELNRLIEEDGLRGMTSNPSIFEKAISGSDDYDETLRRTLEADPHLDTEALFEVLAIEDIQAAADVLRPLYDQSRGGDGYVSLEVSPRLANDTEGTVSEARRLWGTVDRPNLMIKVPATREGIPAIEELIGEGVNVNVTLMFSLRHYEDVAHAYLRGLERCKDVSQVASVASFFVSRVDGVVDKVLLSNGSPEAKALLGKIAVANAKLAYKRFQEIFRGEPFAALKAKGANVQRPLWASTSTKNPDYNDVLYVEELIGRDTVNTLPPATLKAFRDHGRTELTLERDVEAAQAAIDALPAFGIDFDAVTEKLQVDGVAAFAKSYEELLEALKKKRSQTLSSRSEDQYLNLHEVEGAVNDRLAAWERAEYPARLWDRDPTLWGNADTPELTNRLGWLELPRVMHDQLPALRALGEDVWSDDTRYAVLCGMGGSSLAPEVYQQVFGNCRGFPELIVLDSTHPATVRAVTDRIDPRKTLFIVSSKSGTTTETLSFFRHFWSCLDGAVPERGRHFIAVTDPGTPLEGMARERGFRKTFHAPPDVGGRYSALSVFGLVPAAVIGMDVHAILDGAWAMMENTRTPLPVAERAAFGLGAALGELAVRGRDKLTLVPSASLAGFPAWIEQLIAESTGKDGKGILPVVDEPLGTPDVYGPDRVFVSIAVSGEHGDHEQALARLERAGHPVVRIHIRDRSLLGQEFYRWEVATAAAGSVLGIHPFDQPDVQLAKQMAKERMADPASREGVNWDDGVRTVEIDDADSVGERAAAIQEWLAGARSGDYVAIQAFVAATPETTESLQRVRVGVRDRLRVATTLGYGPRFLHSTGQLHKGGAANGWFLQVVDDATADLSVPESDYTFGQLVRAQASGDALALRDRGRRLLRVRLREASLLEILASAAW